MAQSLSFDKIVYSYFSAVTSVEFEYKGVLYKPKKLTISPLLFRDFSCPSNCGGCCPRFSLDYLPEEKFPYSLQKRTVLFNGKNFDLFSDLQLENKNHHCKNLKKDGRCGIHGKHPFSCDFELIRILTFKEEKRRNILVQKLYGRGWAMLRVDGLRGAKCEMLDISENSILEVIRKFKRLQQWCDYFELPNKCPEILEYCEKYLKSYKQKKLF